MIKRIIALLASLAVVVGLMTCSSSYAWFVSSAKKAQSISVSVVSSVHSANLTDLDTAGNVIIMQGDNLVSLDGKDAMLQIENKSTTDTQIRISIEYTSYKSGSAEQVIYSASDNDDIAVTFADKTWSKNVNGSGVCYFYYMGKAYKSAELESIDKVPAIGSDVSVIKAISSIAYKDNISYAYSGQKINIKVTFESKQADNVTWSTVDSYNVSGTAK
jgi:hypothetical protein